MQGQLVSREGCWWGGKREAGGGQPGDCLQDEAAGRRQPGSLTCAAGVAPHLGPRCESGALCWGAAVPARGGRQAAGRGREGGGRWHVRGSAAGGRPPEAGMPAAGLGGGSAGRGALPRPRRSCPTLGGFVFLADVRHYPQRATGPTWRGRAPSNGANIDCIMLSTCWKGSWKKGSSNRPRLNNEGGPPTPPLLRLFMAPRHCGTEAKNAAQSASGWRP
jgi:hypothetical protein